MTATVSSPVIILSWFLLSLSNSSALCWGVLGTYEVTPMKGLSFSLRDYYRFKRWS